MVEVSLTVGKLDASLALLLTKDHHLIEFPTILLPDDVEAGSIIKIVCEKDTLQEEREAAEFEMVQDEILQTFGTQEPQNPVLRTRNITQTSVVLEWDPIVVGQADIQSLTLYKNGSRVGIIPQPLTRTASKLSGLSIDAVYNFQLVLATSAGHFVSNVLEFKTHKMTDLSGITVCIGTIDESQGVTLEDVEQSLKRIGAKPIQSEVKLDTTHFMCTSGVGVEWTKALKSNIPVVRPEWVLACEYERRLVGVRSYYLDADPKTRPPVKRRADSVSSTSAPNNRDINLATHIPEREQSQNNGSTIESPLPSIPQESVEEAIQEKPEEFVEETQGERIGEEHVEEERVEEEPVQEEPVQEEPVQEEPVQEEPVQEESLQEEFVQEPVQEKFTQSMPKPVEKTEFRDLTPTTTLIEGETQLNPALNLSSPISVNEDIYADEYDSFDEDNADADVNANANANAHEPNLDGPTETNDLINNDIPAPSAGSKDSTDITADVNEEVPVMDELSVPVAEDASTTTPVVSAPSSPMIGTPSSTSSKKKNKKKNKK